MTIKERIEARHKVRAKLMKKRRQDTALVLISHSIDDYLEHRIETDKVQEGILKDIQGNVAN